MHFPRGQQPSGPEAHSAGIGHATAGTDQVPQDPAHSAFYP
jgi:hypothetical protein